MFGVQSRWNLKAHLGLARTVKVHVNPYPAYEKLYQNLSLWKMKNMLSFFIPFLFLGCHEIQEQAIKHNIMESTANEQLVQTTESTLEKRFLPPKGYKRPTASTSSYTSFLRNIELKPHGSTVHLYNGIEKHNKVADAVLRFDVGKYDLQQCADAVMRIRAEYLFSQKRYRDIHFKFTNGFQAEYLRWQQGERIVVSGNTCQWVKKAKVDTSYDAFRNYLEKVYAYAGSLSLSKELLAVKNLKSIEAGDVFIKGGTPGHAVTVMDVAMNAKGEKIFLLSQSYMPAQDIHILKNFNDLSISPWYRVSDIESTLETPEYTFEPQDLMRFAE